MTWENGLPAEEPETEWGGLPVLPLDGYSSSISGSRPEEVERIAQAIERVGPPPTLRVVEEAPDPRDDPDFEGAGEESAERIREAMLAALGIYTVSSLAELPSADEQSIVGEGILTRGGKLLIHGASGVGKTTLAHDLGGCLSVGRPWVGRFAVDAPRRVLCVQGELSLPEMSSHAQQLLGAGYDAPGLCFARMTDLRLPDGEATLRELVNTAGASVLVLDPWYRLFTGESSNLPE
jgi:hypothetical protein